MHTHRCSLCGRHFTPRCVPCQMKTGGIRCPLCRSLRVYTIAALHPTQKRPILRR